MNTQKKANEILKNNLDQNQVFFTEDGQAFFEELKATNHARTNKLEDPVVFFREGFEPEDTKEMEQELVYLKEDNKKLSTVLEIVNAICDLDKEAPEINDATPAIVVGVITLREAITQEKETTAAIYNLVNEAIDAEKVPEVTDETPEIIGKIILLRETIESLTLENEALKAAATVVVDAKTVTGKNKQNKNNG